VTGPSPYLKDVDAVVCDLDGVVYRGGKPIEGSPEAIRTLRASGLRVLFCTNNALPMVGDFTTKLGGMGVPCSVDDIVTSSVVAAEVIARDHPGATVLVVGGPGLREAVAKHGLSVVGSGKADAVVAGLDPTFDYDAMTTAASAVRAGAPFYATNDDASYPAEDGLRPGAGAIVAAIEVASGAKPVVLGKPNRPMMEAVVRRLPEGARVAMVGDRPETDLGGAHAMGWRTILVLTGVTSRDEAKALERAPDAIVERLASLV
jgi:4-nitrophenyl phosphatase